MSNLGRASVAASRSCFVAKALPRRKPSVFWSERSSDDAAATAAGAGAAAGGSANLASFLTEDLRLEKRPIVVRRRLAVARQVNRN